MPYQGVSTPRFYIDLLSYISSLNLGYWAGQQTGYMEGADSDFANYAGVNYDDTKITIDNPNSMLGFNPALRSRIKPIGGSDSHISFSFNFYEQLSRWFDPQNKTNFISILGHNLANRRNQEIERGLDMFVTAWIEDGSYEEIHNAEKIATGEVGLPNYEVGMRPMFDNASFFKFTHTFADVVWGDLSDYSFGRAIPSFALQLKLSTRGDIDGTFPGIGLDDIYIGSITCGRFFDMPHSPELQITMSHDYSGVKKYRGVLGGEYSNSNWDGPPKWGDLSAWELPSPTGTWFGGMLDFQWKYSGRRVWEMEFNQMDAEDMEPFNEGGVGTEGERKSNWLQDVIRMTHGGTLPFVFCPDPQVSFYDGNINGVSDTQESLVPPRGPQFAICQLDMRSFKKEQVANGIYKFNITVREVW